MAHYDIQLVLFSSIVCKSNEVVRSISSRNLRKRDIVTSMDQGSALVLRSWPLHCLFLLEAEDKVVVFCE